MPTPASGTISMLNMRSEITRGTGAISMSEVRTRYGGGTSAISFNGLYDCEGWIQTNGQYVSKFFTHEGWGTFTGSINPNEGGSSPNALGSLIFTTTSPGSRLTAAYTVSGGSTTNMTIANNSGSGAGTVIATGYRAQDVTRVVFANTSRTLGAASSNNALTVNYTQPSSGTYHNLIQF